MLRTANWIIDLIIKLILDEIASGGLDKLGESIKGYLIPLVKSRKDDLIKTLREKAKGTQPEFDDALVNALDQFLDGLIPDCDKALASCKSA